MTAELAKRIDNLELEVQRLVRVVRSLMARDGARPKTPRSHAAPLWNDKKARQKSWEDSA